ncbi:hypothetical protein KY290_036725 [Solanum tuberosum]|uniref:Uncharacterized protein n=1 Tax=Solanum tuberosum TaxID=4113 RepID=A0ABQ7TXC0_SOLTU|nr:hypothetical protein KY289_036209 [Solanum tuberosum]KAH0639455.1 hypothetical protein KY285_036041 [Solanum tuberosum]KAH0738020.1 hypothetical protein KY290_036725 [Solanum tuberosum]
MDVIVPTKEDSLRQQDYFSQLQIGESSGVYTGEEGLEVEALNIEFLEDFNQHTIQVEQSQFWPITEAQTS